MVYGSAANTVHGGLDVIQVWAFRLCTGAAKTSHVCALQVEAGEMLLCSRKKQLRVNYWIHLRGHGDNHPTKKVLQACWEREGKVKIMFWLDRRCSSKRPVWIIESLVVDLELLQVKARRKSPDLVQLYRK